MGGLTANTPHFMILLCNIMVVQIQATAATTLLKAGIPDKMALHRTLETLQEYQSLDINDTKRVSDALRPIVIISKTLVLTCLMNLM